MTQYAYTRVSTEDQSLDLQINAMRQAGIEKVAVEKMSGANTDRPILQKLLAHLRRGDTLVVWKLDRLGRSLQHLIEIVADLQGRGIGFRSLTENIDTTSPGGKLIFHIFGALAEFERSIIIERTLAGVRAAQAKGVHCGRPFKKPGDPKSPYRRKVLTGKGA